MRLFSAVLSLLAAHQAPDAEPATARTPSGIYRGKSLSSASGRTFLAFSGLRYAKPVTGETRFQEASLPDDSTEIIEALTEGSECLQIDPIESPGVVTGEDDCLFLNVYTPNISTTEPLPVMMFIHGGGWRFGSGGSRSYGPQPIMDKDVVLVTINYRLGPIGFSSLEDDVHPGNLGLKDQRVALLWVKRNILGFGGDPERITLFGYSAGGASVHFHMLSPLSSGLFQKGISESGTAFSPWALSQPGVGRARTLQLAEMLNCTSATNSSKKIMECLQTKGGEDIVKAVMNFSLLDQELVLFRPVVESKKGFIREDPWTSPPATMPWVAGTTSAETGYFAVALNAGSGTVLAFLDVFYEFIAPQVLMIADVSPEPARVAKAVRNKYFQDLKISQENIQSVIEMLSDAWFTYPTYKAMSGHNGTVYNYYFDHKGQANIVKAFGSDKDFGAVHGEEIPYLFTNNRVNIYENGSENDRRISREIVDLWTNFAIDGEPSKDDTIWRPWTHDKRKTLHIRSNSMKMEDNILGDRLLFWDSLPVRRTS